VQAKRVEIQAFCELETDRYTHRERERERERESERERERERERDLNPAYFGLEEVRDIEIVLKVLRAQNRRHKDLRTDKVSRVSSQTHEF
jgi:hypothetical protein